MPFIRVSPLGIDLGLGSRLTTATGHLLLLLLPSASLWAAPANTANTPAATGLPSWAIILGLVFLVAITLALVHIQRARLLLERQQVEQERVLVKRLKEVDKLKDEFLANTSHELLTPLNGIIGLAESLLDGAQGDLTQRSRYSLELIASSAKRLATVVDDILDFSRLKNQALTLQTKPLDLHLLVDLVLPLMRALVADKPVHLLNEVPEDLPAVLADEERLMQILQNLIGNAVKFTQDGYVKVSARQDESLVEICIADTGIGIARDKFQEIFEAFHQVGNHTERRYGGSGLGLSITRQLVELHGGNIWLESELNRGTQFYFTLPLSLEEPLRHKVDVADTRPTLGAYGSTLEEDAGAPAMDSAIHILVVDDDSVNRKVLNNYLTRRNYRVSEAASGEAALDFFASGREVDLILLDIMMPEMSGFDVCKRLREKFAAHKLPIIFLTALNQLEDMVTGFEVGANDYLTKPIAKEELLARVGLHLQLQQANRDLDKKVAERTQALHQSNEGLKLAQRELQDAYRKLELASLSDPLTGLHNRRFLDQHMAADIALVDRAYGHWLKSLEVISGQPWPQVPPLNQDIIFILLDVDHFKWVNDEYGHGAGDTLLEQLGQRLQQALRDSDYLVRWGGEEFLIVARFCNREEAAEMAERIRHKIEERPFDLGAGLRLTKTCSLGYGVYPFFPRQPDALTWEQVVNIADRALYIAKNSGRNAWVGINGCDEESQRVNPALSKNLASLVAAGVVELDSNLALSKLVLGD